MGNERLVLIKDTEIDGSDFFPSSFSLLIFPLSIILMLKPAGCSVLRSSATTVLWLTSLNSYLCEFQDKDTRWEALGATIITRKTIHHCMHVPVFQLRALEMGRAVSRQEEPAPSGLISAAAPDELLLPPDGTVLLAFSSQPGFTPETAKRSCLGCPWQQLQKNCSKAAVRHGKAGSREGKAEEIKPQKYLGQKRYQKDSELQRASAQHRHKHYWSL